MNRHRQRGFALPAAVGALVIIGVLVTAGFYMSQQELRIGVASRFGAMAVNIAQSGTNSIIVNQTGAMAGMSTWDTLRFTGSQEEGTYEVLVTKLSSRLFYMDATATVTEGGALWAGASRRMGLVTRLSSADIDPPAALTTQGGLKYGGSAEVHGIDSAPDGSDGGQANWAGYCDSSNYTDKPGILIDDTLNIDWNGNRNKIEGNMTGDPVFTQDTSITVESLMTFGDLGWDELTALADIEFTSDPGSPSSVETNGRCDTSVDTNWGEPIDQTSDCWGYYPIIYLNNPNSTIGMSGGYGQGILLVEGDLKVTGGFEFYGPVFVKGTLTTMGSGGHFWGGVVAANANIETNTVLGNAVITYSSCAIERALLNNSSLTQLRPLAMRSWVDLTNIIN